MIALASYIDDRSGATEEYREGMTTRAVCFDLDDTLYAYHEYARTGLASAADRLSVLTGEDHHDELETMYFEEGITNGTFDKFLDRHGYPDEYAGELVEAFHDATTALQPYPDTIDTLTDLADEYKLGLITDGREGQAKLRRLGLVEYFDEILVTPTTDYSKRHAEVFDRMLGDLDVTPSQSVYVGDDPRVDFEIPNQLGMRTVRVRRGRYKDLEPESERASPDHEVQHLQELREHL